MSYITGRQIRVMHGASLRRRSHLGDAVPSELELRDLIASTRTMYNEIYADAERQFAIIKKDDDRWYHDEDETKAALDRLFVLKGNLELIIGGDRSTPGFTQLVMSLTGKQFPYQLADSGAEGDAKQLRLEAAGLVNRMSEVITRWGSRIAPADNLWDTELYKKWYRSIENLTDAGVALSEAAKAAANRAKDWAGDNPGKAIGIGTVLLFGAGGAAIYWLFGRK